MRYTPGQGRSSDKLELTDQQKPEFDKLRTEHLKKMIDQRAKVAVAEVDLRALFRAETPQKAAIEKKVKEIADLKTQAAVSRVDHWFAVQKILTPEQQKVWKQSLGQQASRHRGRMMGPQKSPGMMRGQGMMREGPPSDR
jgi:Spy/CpxP family protein refolding chaperone